MARSPFLSDDQLAELERNSSWRERGDACPTCGERGNRSGSYKAEGGEVRECKADRYGMHEQHRLFRLYCLANIPEEFMGLDWGDYPHREVKLDISEWAVNFHHVRRRGLGFELYGKHGTGKTWAVTHALKSVVKQGYSGWWCQFGEIPALKDRPDDERHFKLAKMRESEVLVVDDIRAPWTWAQRAYYEDVLEDVFRERAHTNFPTLTTSNLTVEEWKQHYPRLYAQLSNKQRRIVLGGANYRDRATDEELEANGEVRPIL